MLSTGFQRMRSYIRQRSKGSCLQPYNTRQRDRQIEPWNETHESKRAEREEDVPVCIPINRIKVHGCLSGDGTFGNVLEMLEFCRDNGLFEKHDSLVQFLIHSYEDEKKISMVWVLKIEESASYSYQGNWEHAEKLLESVINSDLMVEYSDVIKARAHYFLVAHMRRKEEYRDSKSNTDQLFKLLESSVHLLQNYDSPEDWAGLYQTYGYVWMDRMNQLPLDERNVTRANAMDCIRGAMYFSKQDHRERVQMKRQSDAHLSFAMIHLGCCSTFPPAQENHCSLNDIKEAKRHLDFIKSKFGDTIPTATKMLFWKTASDLCYRKGQYQLAKKKVGKAYKCAVDHGFNTELNTLKERRDFYQKQLETCDQKVEEKAQRDGFVDVQHGRILPIGQDRAGETSLKKSLLGQPFDPEEQSTEGVEVQASTCEIEVEQVKNWQSIHVKPGLLECPKDISRIVVEKLCDGATELERGHSTAATEATAITEEEHLIKEEGAGLIDRNDPNKHQV